MSKSITIEVSAVIHVSPANVWEALTKPEMIKQYLFGTEIVTDWKVGSPIVWRGFWQGTLYEDRGVVLEIVPEHLLKTTYWSSMSGLEDVPENYKTVIYQLTEESNQTRITIIQDNVATDEEKESTEQNWITVLDTMKKLLEE